MFRDRYLNYAQLMGQLEGWAATHADLVRLCSLGQSAEGRSIPMLIVGRDPDRLRPAVWIDANMHASEVCGTNVALAIVSDLIALMSGAEQVGGKPLAKPMAAALREALFYVVPRLSPDGAEQFLSTGRPLRSSPVDEQIPRKTPRWVTADIDGDGSIGCMRQISPGGELSELRDEEGVRIEPPVLVPRLPEDEGPFFKLYPEGQIENFDGHHIPDPHYLSDNSQDFNRNFPHHWVPEPQEAGAGPYPGSAPETRAVLEFATRHANIMVWLSLHTFGGVLIRPLGDQPDSKMDPLDLSVFEQVEAWMAEYTGYPTVSGFHEFLYSPDKTIHGDLMDYAYHQRGALAYVVELWDVFKQVGIAPKKPFMDNYIKLTRKDMRALVKFDREHNAGRIFKPWRKFNHPQFGEVELAGFDPSVGIINPPLERIAQTCDAQSAAFLRVASLLPQLTLEVLRQTQFDTHVCTEVRIRNDGYFATYGPSSAKALPHAERLRLTVKAEGAQVLSPTAPQIDIGHLEGWGGGLYGRASGFEPWTRGNDGERVVSVITAGSGRLFIEVQSCRVGTFKLEVRVP
ncbi:M14 family metallopeptidase [Roseateles sp. P5_E4]